MDHIFFFFFLFCRNGALSIQCNEEGENGRKYDICKWSLFQSSHNSVIFLHVFYFVFPFEPIFFYPLNIQYCCFDRNCFILLYLCCKICNCLRTCVAMRTSPINGYCSNAVQLPWLSLFCSAVLRLARSADCANGKFNLSSPFIIFG